ncbi:SdpI family protein [Priestia filamentosa]|uniref:SdpI family protein n=1 Tax=Priestia filamentosa TaxID=1402861 RepID=UPI002E23BC5E|nr:SdpI family protein [Priestia filamentosa]
MKKHVFPLIIMSLSILCWVILYNKLPSQIPMQWGVDGNVNSYAPKLQAAFTHNGILLFLYAVLVLSPKMDPRKQNYQKFSRSYRIITLAIMLVLFLLNISVLLASLGYNLNVTTITPILVGILFIILGNYMQTVKPNFFIGIRTAWTLSNEQVWRKTHRLGSKLFILGGLLFFVTPFLPEQLLFPLIISIILAVVLIPTLYSYVQYRKITE